MAILFVAFAAMLTISGGALIYFLTGRTNETEFGPRIEFCDGKSTKMKEINSTTCLIDFFMTEDPVIASECTGEGRIRHGIVDEDPEGLMVLFVSCDGSTLKLLYKGEQEFQKSFTGSYLTPKSSFIKDQKCEGKIKGSVKWPLPFYCGKPALYLSPRMIGSMFPNKYFEVKNIYNSNLTLDLEELSSIAEQWK
jgi:hypothetical protein